MLTLVILLVIAFPVMALIGLLIGLATRDQLRNLERSIASLERRVAAMGAVPPPSPSVAAATAPPEVHVEEPEPEPVTVEESVAEPWQVPPYQPPPASPTPPAVPSPQGPSLEERFGTQWVVWVGGVAIAFGGFFLVRLSIEQGWFAPPCGSFSALSLQSS